MSTTAPSQSRRVHRREARASDGPARLLPATAGDARRRCSSGSATGSTRIMVPDPTGAVIPRGGFPAADTAACQSEPAVDQMLPLDVHGRLVVEPPDATADASAIAGWLCRG